MVLNKSRKDKRFAPPYQHKKELKPIGAGCRKAFIDTVLDVVGGVADETVKLGIGTAKTLLGNGPTDQIRFDRQRCLSGSHSKDTFVNYQLQANMQASDKLLASLAAHGNGNNRAQGGLGGSTLSSVNVQTLDKSQRAITPERLGHALYHSNQCDAPIWVLDRQSNVDTVPASRRQHNAVYHANPYTGYTDDATNDSMSPFYGADKGSGLLSTLSSRFFRPPKGGYTDNFPTNDLGIGDCPHCGAGDNLKRKICWNCQCPI